jgi:hypothetical protein
MMVTGSPIPAPEIVVPDATIGVFGNVWRLLKRR